MRKPYWNDNLQDLWNIVLVCDAEKEWKSCKTRAKKGSGLFTSIDEKILIAQTEELSASTSYNSKINCII